VLADEMVSEHSLPVKPGRQRQVKLFRWSSQVPLCWHGSSTQSSMSVSHRRPATYTTLQLQESLADAKISARQQCPLRKKLQQINDMWFISYRWLIVNMDVLFTICDILSR